MQKARVTALQKLEDLGEAGVTAAKGNLMRDCCALSLLSLIPPE